MKTACEMAMEVYVSLAMCALTAEIFPFRSEYKVHTHARS